MDVHHRYSKHSVEYGIMDNCNERDYSAKRRKHRCHEHSRKKQPEIEEIKVRETSSVIIEVHGSSSEDEDIVKSGSHSGNSETEDKKTKLVKPHDTKRKHRTNDYSGPHERKEKPVSLHSQHRERQSEFYKERNEKDFKKHKLETMSRCRSPREDDRKLKSKKRNRSMSEDRVRVKQEPIDDYREKKNQRNRRKSNSVDTDVKLIKSERITSKREPNRDSRDNRRIGKFDQERKFSAKSSNNHSMNKKEPDTSGPSTSRGFVKRRNDETDSFEWGKKTDKEGDVKKEPENKLKPDFGLSGKLTEDTNMFNGVVIKYSEPPEARMPKKRWRLYPFKGDEGLKTLYIHRQSAYLIGRDRKVADIPVDHPSCSKQHAALQYRLVTYKRANGTSGKQIRLYIIDLESANGTHVNAKRIDSKKYVELLEKDVVKFGYSSREYVLLHEGSKDSESEDDS